jgi:hypothetical protein
LRLLRALLVSACIWLSGPADVAFAAPVATAVCVASSSLCASGHATDARERAPAHAASAFDPKRPALLPVPRPKPACTLPRIVLIPDLYLRNLVLLR